MLFNNRKQDGVIFVGTKSSRHVELLKKLASRVPGMFRSNCPVIMPIEYSTIIQMKLDSHALFYTKEKDEVYKLIDKFSVQGGAPIVLELGTWDRYHGVSLKKRINRWDRRTDLFGAPFINALSEEGEYDKKGSIIGSEEWFQDILFYVTDRLNLTVSIIDTKGDNPLDFLLRKIADVTSDKIGHELGTFGQIQIPLSIHRQTETLFAGVHSGTAPEAWVFIEVFGFWQRFAIFSTLVVIAILWPIIQITLEKNKQRPPLYEGLVNVSLFLIQIGKQPDTRFWALRFLALTTSMMTLLVFVYFSNDITSKMTAGPPPIHVHTFDDALDKGYEVIVTGLYHWQLLQSSKNRTAMHAIYEKYIKQYENDILDYNRWKSVRTQEEIEAGVEYDKIDNVPKWFLWTDQSLNWAAETIINNKKVLWFSHESDPNYDKTWNIVSLKMDDSHYTYVGFGLQEDSEFMTIFNHYLLKAYENGILNRLDLFYNRPPDIKIGLKEPEPLGMNNVMFTFLFLAASFVISTAIAVMENLLHHIKQVKVTRARCARETESTTPPSRGNSRIQPKDDEHANLQRQFQFHEVGVWVNDQGARIKTAKESDLRQELASYKAKVGELEQKMRILKTDYETRRDFLVTVLDRTKRSLMGTGGALSDLEKTELEMVIRGVATDDLEVVTSRDVQRARRAQVMEPEVGSKGRHDGRGEGLRECKGDKSMNSYDKEVSAIVIDKKGLFHFGRNKNSSITKLPIGVTTDDFGAVMIRDMQKARRDQIMEPEVGNEAWLDRHDERPREYQRSESMNLYDKKVSRIVIDRMGFFHFGRNRNLSRKKLLKQNVRQNIWFSPKTAHFCRNAKTETRELVSQMFRPNNQPTTCPDNSLFKNS